jgi:hypothetical protein
VAEAASTLITILTDNPADARVAAELAVLTGVDLRDEPDPALAWWGWWDVVVHDDAIAWLRGAAERHGIAAPLPEDLTDEGTRAGALFLLRVLQSGEPHLADRARRELGRLLGHDLGRLPEAGPRRDEWLEAIEHDVEIRWDVDTH